MQRLRLNNWFYEYIFHIIRCPFRIFCSSTYFHFAFVILWNVVFSMYFPSILFRTLRSNFENTIISFFCYSVSIRMHIIIYTTHCLLQFLWATLQIWCYSAEQHLLLYHKMIYSKLCKNLFRHSSTPRGAFRLYLPFQKEQNKFLRIYFLSLQV